MQSIDWYIEQVKNGGENCLTGEQAFKLHDTYGFPLDLTIEMAEEKGLSVDTDGFNAAMEAQKKAARDARADGSSWDAVATYEFDNAEPTVFCGYDNLTVDAKIVGLVMEGEVTTVLPENAKGFIVVDKTPFYAEMGGEIGDVGSIAKDGVLVAEVINTTKTGDGYFLHDIHIDLRMLLQKCCDLALQRIKLWMRTKGLK